MSICQPKASFNLFYTAYVTNPNKKDIKLLNKRIQWQIKNLIRGLNFVKLNIKIL